MPYVKRIGGSHHRREKGGMVRYATGEILWMEEWEVENFKNAFEVVSEEAGRRAMQERGLDPEEIEGRTIPPAPPVDTTVYEPSQPVEEEEELEPAPVGLEIVPKGGGWYDVINRATGEPLNDRALRKPAAELLVAGSKAGADFEEATDPVEGA